MCRGGWQCGKHESAGETAHGISNKPSPSHQPSHLFKAARRQCCNGIVASGHQRIPRTPGSFVPTRYKSLLPHSYLYIIHSVWRCLRISYFNTLAVRVHLCSAANSPSFPFLRLMKKPCASLDPCPMVTHSSGDEMHGNRKFHFENSRAEICVYLGHKNCSASGYLTAN